MATIKMTLRLPQVRQNWWRSAQPELEREVEKYNKEQWAKERDPVTLKPWAPRVRPTGGWPILRRTGTMQDTAKFKSSPGQPMIFKVETTDYGPFLQFGTKKMVQRRWLGIGGELNNKMAKIIGKHIFLPRGKVYRIEA